MDRKEIEQKIKEVLADRLDVNIAKIKLDSDLVEDLGMDSFTAVEVAFEIKEIFGVEVKDHDFDKLKIPAKIIEHIINHLNS
jgi:acyl carrier protein